MENEIECFYRKYRVKTPAGMIIEIESDKPLSTQLNIKLLEEEPEIDEFFKSHKILATRQLIRTHIDPKKKDISGLAEPTIIAKDGSLSPRQRLNELLKMKGEFTRQDYVESLFTNFRYKLNKWTSHTDIKDALQLNKIQMVRKEKRSRVYKVIDTEEVEESLYTKLLQDRKLQMSILT
jgi:hypothetical protein